MCLLADLKLWLGITDSLNDVMLQRVITNLSQRILSKLGRPDGIKSASYTESYDGTGTSQLSLRHYPIISVASLLINTAPISASPDGVQTGFVFDAYALSLIGSAQPLQASPGYYGPPGTFIRGRNNITVTYTAGYAAVPLDLTEACIQWAAYNFRGRNWIGITSKHMGTGETDSFSQKPMPDFVTEALQPYIKRVPT